MSVSNELLKIKAIKDNDITYCDKWVKYVAINEVQYCKLDFYINKLLSTKDKKICNTIEKWFTDITIFWSDKSNDEICNKLYLLVSDKEITEQKVEDFVKFISNSWEMDNDLLAITKTYFLNKNFCNELDTVWAKIKCLDFFYKDDFFKEFKDKVYTEIIKTKYLYQ
jgi:hypothetical protein